MNDTPPHIADLHRRLVMLHTPEERVLMGVDMFDVARAMILASLPTGMSDAERVYALLKRIYGDELSEETRLAVKARVETARYHQS